jgi:hypothetical protein
MNAKALGIVCAAILSTGLAGCGGEDASPTQPAPTFHMAGTYSAQWLIQFYRSRDGFTGSFNCYGTMTIAQPASSSNTITGFAVVGSPCPPQTFDLSGTVQADGTLAFVSGGPRPPEGQCPAASGAPYNGVVTDNGLSAHATAMLNCPGPGEGPHRFDYILSAWRSF